MGKRRKQTKNWMGLAHLKKFHTIKKSNEMSQRIALKHTSVNDTFIIQ